MLRNLVLMRLEYVQASGKQVWSQTKDCGSDTISSQVASDAGPTDTKANVGRKTAEAQRTDREQTGRDKKQYRHRKRRETEGLGGER